MEFSMAEPARRLSIARLSSAERFDAGIDLSNRMIEARLESFRPPVAATPKERVRAQFRFLRGART